MNCKKMFTPIGKFILFKLNDSIYFFNSWGISSLQYQFSEQNFLYWTNWTFLKTLCWRIIQYVKKQEINKSSFAKHYWAMNPYFIFNSVDIISKPTCINELSFLQVFHIYKKFENIVESEFAILSLSDFWKCNIKMSFPYIFSAPHFSLAITCNDVFLIGY